jgi:hypothetical protein
MRLLLARPTLAALALLAAPLLVHAQAVPAAAQPAGRFAVGDRIDGDYLGWCPGRVLEVLHDGQQYVVELSYPDGSGKPFRYTLPAFKLRRATGPTPAPATEAFAGAPLVGRYGCTQSVRVSGGYQPEMRGSVTLQSGGRYTYVMGKPGRHAYDAATGVTTFTGGFLDGATATDIDGKRNRLFITTLPESGRGRWACSTVD